MISFPVNKTTFPTLMLLLMSALPGVSQAWWNSDWSARKQITLDTTKAGADLAEGLTQAPVLLRLHTGNFNFLDAKEDGADLRFVGGDDKTPLKYHIEKFDGINELAWVWVQVPQLAAASKHDAIWMYYGNPKAATGSDAPGTYDAHQLAVYHFDGAPEAPLDQTSFALHAQATGTTRDSAGVSGGALAFNGSGRVLIPAAPALQFPAGALTFSAWIKSAAPQRDAIVFVAQDAAQAVTIHLDQAQLYARVSVDGVSTDTPKSAPMALGGWHHIGLIGGAHVSLYLDGVEVGVIDRASPSMKATLALGAAVAGGNYFTGALDEVQISNVARPAGWITLAARSQGADTKLASYGAEEKAESGGNTSYFSTILHSVTLDGWVVIGVLMVMAAISWVVMAGKVVVLSKARKDNKRFMHSFERLATANPAALDRDEIDTDAAEGETPSPFATALFGAHDHYQSSPIYRIYHVGIREIKQRFGNTDPHAVGKVLSPQSLGAIRASLEAALMRENQKLNNQMVLLTIAISGGPFLGLLGTVVGVMITFAAIAASGDVNVNAIAPGIAAALVATVAGLAVAIPALFGYNYLLSHIKSMVTDMHVFVDEFSHKLAENYGA